MATVYRARDERHDRSVALKLLKPDLAAAVGADRFLAEIRTTAKLQHPNILPLFDSGNAAAEDVGGGDALLFYVMPFVAGESLRERLEREGALPVGEAVRITIAVADALAYAHRQGVIHRDIKPENILLHEHRPLVADFGIAVAANRSAGERLTETGLMIGTPAYMSPEQAGGDIRVDRRSDVYALGCVAYEMLAGEPPHTGPTPRAIMARSLTGDPRPLRELRSAVPAHVDAAVRTALRPLPSDRFQDATDFAAALADPHYRLPGQEARPTERRRRWLWGAAWAASLIAAVWLSRLMRTWPVGGAPGAGAAPVSRFVHVLPPDQSFTSVASHSLVAVSPDGSSFVYVANDRLHLRDMATLHAIPVRGSEGEPKSPFFSPDGESVAYWDAAAQELRRIPVSGGAPVTLTSATILYGASWSADGTIVYGQPDGIWRVPANGGAAERIVTNEPATLAYGPSMLPEGTALLFSVVARPSMIGQSTAWDSAAVAIQDLETGERTEIVRGGDARYVPTGHLVYAVDTVLFAIPFDVRRRQRRGAPVPVVEAVQRTIRGGEGQAGGANYDFSRDGTLVYVPAGAAGAFANLPRRLVAVDRQGNTDPLIDEERNYWRPRISPDGRRVAVEILPESQSTEVWIADLDRRTISPFARTAASAYPLWMPDGRSVLYWSKLGSYRQAADGSGDAELLLADARANDVSRDSVVAFSSVAVGSLVSLTTFRLGDDSASDYLTTESRAAMARFSPDGKWLAYTSKESGQQEIYVRPYPRAPGVAKLVSTDGGTAPVWAPDGSELYYQGASGFIMAVPTTLTPSFSVSRPEPLFRYAGRFRMSGTATAYDIHPDGTLFIMVQEPETLPAQSPRVNVVRNWFEELTSRVR
jgi:serine/threonine-protein kinase